MGAHKYNPTAIAAKNGEIPPKPKTISKRKMDALLMARIREVTGIDRIARAMGTESYY